VINKKTKIISICLSTILLGSTIAAGWAIQKYKKKISSSTSTSLHTSNFTEYSIHSKFDKTDLNNYFLQWTYSDGSMLYNINSNDFGQKINLLAEKAFSNISQFKSEIGLLHVYIDYYQKDSTFETEIIWSTSSDTYKDNTTDYFYYDCFDLFIE